MDGNFEITDGNDVRVDALTGGGTITRNGYPGSETKTLTVGANNGSGTFTGTMQVRTADATVASGNLGQASNVAANLVFDGGTLQYTGSTAGTDRNFTINTGKTATVDVTTNNLTVSGSSTTTNGALTKTGSGTLTLTGTTPTPVRQW